MSDVEMDDLVDTKVCVKCGGEKIGDPVGSYMFKINN